MWDIARRGVGLRSVRTLSVLVTLLAVSACSTPPDRAVNEKELRTLGRNDQAMRARGQAERELRTTARAYVERASMPLGLLIVRDHCVPGSGPGWFFQQETDDFRVVCSMDVTAYYGAGPRDVGDTLDRILTAGDHGRSGRGVRESRIPFTHDREGRRLVAFYRGRGTAGRSSRAPESTNLTASGQILSWDATAGGPTRQLVEEPYAGPNDDPPVSRSVHDPKAATVSGIRKRYGLVFRLRLPHTVYYAVLKNGHVRTE
ncbi:hypothetical protein [Streptomyces sp. 1222.5]|uniref:hypothetical protein n=1 Tax=Streptomyces sp. 1222.5 TaxID=1881026 RepID=UPI003D75FEF2